MWLTGLAALWHVGSSQTKAQTRVPCIGRQILNHCATREAPGLVFLIQSATLCPLIEEFNPLTFKVIIDREGFTIAISSVAFVNLLVLFSVFSSLALFLYVLLVFLY